MKSFRFASKLYLLIGICLLLGAASTSWLLYRMRSLTGTYDRLLTKEVAEQDQVRIMQVTFKKQVQEWKDILIRGHEASAMEKHTSQFRTALLAVKKSCEDLRQQIEDPEGCQLLKRFGTAHDKLATEFEAALRGFQATGGINVAAADALVKGKDREPTDLLDQIVALIGRRVTDATRSIHEQGLRE